MSPDNVSPDKTTPADGASDDASEDLRFGQAMEELEEILRQIETEAVDIDALAGRLRRATELLEICRGKIRKAEVEVTQIVQRLDEGAGAGSAEPDEDEDATGDSTDGYDDDIPF